MSRSARFRGVFGDGPHDFQLLIGQLEELQEKCDAGPEEILDRVVEGRWRVADIREPIRLGLVGGGMAAVEALVLTERYAGPGQLMENKKLVISILGAAMMGAPDEDDAPGKPKARAPRRSRAKKSASRPSTK